MSRGCHYSDRCHMMLIAPRLSAIGKTRFTSCTPPSWPGFNSPPPSTTAARNIPHVFDSYHYSFHSGRRRQQHLHSLLTDPIISSSPHASSQHGTSFISFVPPTYNLRPLPGWMGSRVCSLLGSVSFIASLCLGTLGSLAHRVQTRIGAQGSLRIPLLRGLLLCCCSLSRKFHFFWCP
jgi:hypothetical protein